MYATLSYIQRHHPYGEIPEQPSQAPQADSTGLSTAGTGAVNGNGRARAASAQAAGDDGPVKAKTEASTPIPDAPDHFRAAMRELAQDLVMQEQKAEILINSLPGIGNSERDQLKRMQELEGELKRVEAERARAEEQRQRMLGSLNRVIVGLKRVS